MNKTMNMYDDIRTTTTRYPSPILHKAVGDSFDYTKDLLSVAETLHKRDFLFESEAMLRKALVYAAFLRKRLRKERVEYEKLNNLNN